MKKMDLYMATGVKEYWMVEPKVKRISVYHFPDSSHAEARSYIVRSEAGIIAESFIFEGLSIELDRVFR